MAHSDVPWTEATTNNYGRLVYNLIDTVVSESELHSAVACLTELQRSRPDVLGEDRCVAMKGPVDLTDDQQVLTAQVHVLGNTSPDGLAGEVAALYDQIVAEGATFHPYLCFVKSRSGRTIIRYSKGLA